MKHLGDITKINGAEVEPVWVIIGGSPCQDLSVAGKRAGLAGARSGLFMEQIRVIKEMRDADRKSGRAGQFIRPRYMVWENVPGAFSSNKGEDFRAVLEETARIADGNADVPQPPNGKWSNAGCIMGNGWSIAWRVHDAQFWGVPQRRRRISLVADFGGQSAPEILFERKSVSGDIAESGEKGKSVAADAENGVGTAIGVKCLNPSFPQSARVYDANGVWHSLNANENGGQSRDAVLYAPDIARSLTARNDGSPCIDRGPEIVCFAQNQRDEIRDLHDVAGSLAAEPGMKQQTYVAAFSGGQGEKAGGIGYEEEVSPSLKAANSGSNRTPCICIQGNCIDRADTARCNGKGWTEDVSYTLNTIDRPAAFDARGNGDGAISPTLTGDHQNRVTDYTAVTVTTSDMQNTVGTLKARDFKGCEYLNKTLSKTCFNGASVRRLTPLECERLQGYPDGWTDIPGASDSARYKALGNSIALPFWRWMLTRMATYLPADATLGSLFDGIGGFPLIWEEIHGKGSARWASEIEKFPITVTKYHFKEAHDE